MTTNGSRIRVVAAATAIWVLLIWWFGFSVVTAQQAPPHVFIGTAIVDGQLVADGARVTAWINSDMVGDSVIQGGTYTLLVVEPAGRSFGGEKVRFKIGHLYAHEVGYWELGGGVELNLTAASSGPKIVDLTPVKGVPPNHASTDCTDKSLSGCHDSDGGKPQIREITVTHANTDAKRTPIIQAISPASIRIDDSALRLKNQARAEQERLNPQPIPLDDQDQKLRRQRQLDPQMAQQDKKPNTVQDIPSKESDRERISQTRQRAAREARLDQDRKRASREAQLGLERQRVEPEYPNLGVFRIEGRSDQDQKPAGRVPRRNTGRGFFTNSANGDLGGLDRALDPTILAMIGILLTLVATSTSLFKGN